MLKKSIILVMKIRVDPGNFVQFWLLARVIHSQNNILTTFIHRREETTFLNRFIDPREVLTSVNIK